ncbi:MAG: hypothetical protein ACJAUG_001421 [Halioglobus sp.]
MYAEWLKTLKFFPDFQVFQNMKIKNIATTLLLACAPAFGADVSSLPFERTEEREP